MALFEWNEKFETGIPAIDEQHRKLVSFVNDLHDAMRNRKAKEIVEGLIEELASYTVYHFSTEEKAFERYGYARAGEHRKAHADFVDKVNDVKAKHKNGELAISVDILNFLVSWVSDHILKEDMQYVPSLKGKTIQ